MAKVLAWVAGGLAVVVATLVAVVAWAGGVGGVAYHNGGSCSSPYGLHGSA